MKRYRVIAIILCLFSTQKSCGKKDDLEAQLQGFLARKMAGQEYSISSVQNLQNGSYAVRILVWAQNKISRELGLLVHRRGGEIVDIAEDFNTRIFTAEGEEKTMLNRLGGLIAERFDVKKVSYKEGMEKRMSIDVESGAVIATITARFQITGDSNNGGLQGFMYIEKYKFDSSGQWVFYDAKLIEKVH